ncbi:MAG: retroviral-like aspartic protease family protein [Bacteroidales bacterium]|nr:retroviral-like aspartic protease family protein [Bacteroidales bacterium]
MKCIIDAKVDTGSFATVISSATLTKLQLVPFIEDWVELANGEPARSQVCMCRVHLSEDKEMLDVPVYVMNSDNEQALLGMDILSLGDFSAVHYNLQDGQSMLRFHFRLLDEGL